LDELVASIRIERIDVVKIDIEGGELDVLRSAKHILETKRPVVIFEYGTNTWPAFEATVEGLLELVNQCNYSVWMYDSQRRKLFPVTDEVWKLDYTNLVLQPE
jgi:hypothetical protein